jgi:hypothetical protein
MSILNLTSNLQITSYVARKPNQYRTRLKLIEFSFDKLFKRFFEEKEKKYFAFLSTATYALYYIIIRTWFMVFGAFSPK